MFDNQSNWQLVVDHSAMVGTVGDRLRTKILVGNWLLIVADGCRPTNGCRYSVTVA